MRSPTLMGLPQRRVCCFALQCCIVMFTSGLWFPGIYMWLVAPSCVPGAAHDWRIGRPTSSTLLRSCRLPPTRWHSLIPRVPRKRPLCAIRPTAQQPLARAPWHPSAERSLARAGRQSQRCTAGGAQGRTAVWAASWNGHLPVVRLLAERKASLERRCSEGHPSTVTSLSFA